MDCNDSDGSDMKIGLIHPKRRIQVRCLLLCIFVLFNFNSGVAAADALSDLRTAVVEGDAEGVTTALSQGVNVDAVIARKRGSTALIVAAQKGLPGIVKLLLKAGANIEFANKRGRRALHRSIWGSLDAMKVLLEAGANVNAADNRGNQTLNMAAYENRSAMVKLLIKAGADMRAGNERNNTPLHHAAERGSLYALRILIAAGADLNVENEAGETPLAVATEHNRSAAAELLEKAGGK